MKIKTTPEAIFSVEYGGGIKRFFCLGAHVWTTVNEIDGSLGNLKNGKIHNKIVVMKCVDCGRRWCFVIRWKEWRR